jgi:hypothetical protein
MAAAGIVAWIGQKHMAHDSKIHDKVFERLTELDQTIVTKAELQRIDDKLDTILLHMAQR